MALESFLWGVGELEMCIDRTDDVGGCIRSMMRALPMLYESTDAMI